LSAAPAALWHLVIIIVLLIIIAESIISAS